MASDQEKKRNTLRQTTARTAPATVQPKKPRNFAMPVNLANPDVARQQSLRAQASSPSSPLPEATQQPLTQTPGQPAPVAQQPLREALQRAGRGIPAPASVGGADGAVAKTGAVDDTAGLADGPQGQLQLSGRSPVINTIGDYRQAVNTAQGDRAANRNLSFGDVGSDAKTQFSAQGLQTLAKEASGATELDSGAFRKESQQFYADREDSRERQTMNSLRNRIKRGGWGSNAAAESLAGLQKEINARQQGTASLDNQKLALKQQGQFFNQMLSGRQDQRAGNKAVTENLKSYFEQSYTDPEERAARFKMASGVAESLPGLQDANEIDQVSDLLNLAVEDTGGPFTGFDRDPVKAFSEISSITPDGKGGVIIEDLSGKKWPTTPELFGPDLNSNGAARLLALWNKGRSSV